MSRKSKVEAQSTIPQAHADAVTEVEARNAVRQLLCYIGEDPDRPGLAGTPGRVVRALDEMTAGYGADIDQILSVEFPCSEYDQMVTLKDYPFVSMCEHHMLPFTGKATVAYIPKGKVFGLSKLGRLVDAYARRLQIQEQLTEEVAQAIWISSGCSGVGVRIEASHQCMSCRGVNKSGTMITTALRGVFMKPEVRSEFLALW